MDELINWARGDLSPGGRIWSALGPIFLIVAYFVGGLLIYLLRVARKGRFQDEEVASRGKTFLIGFGPREYFAWVTSPIWRLFARFQVPPNAVTTLSVLIAAAAAISVAAGRFSLGGWLYLLAGTCDFIDGRLARATNQASPAGAALDSVLDRYAESVVLIGLGWYYRESWVLLLVFATLTGSLLVPYVRARGEGLGIDVRVGVMQRPERLVLLGLATALSPILEAIFVPELKTPKHTLTVFALLLLAVTTHLTALARLHHVYNALIPGRENAARRWRVSVGRGSLVRTTAAAAAATAVDFAAYMMLVDLLGIRPWAATAIGCAIGGVTNFSISRLWVFATSGPARGQALRYVFVSGSSALLNSGGVAVLLFLPALQHTIAWAIVRGCVFVAWNYPLQRDFVFEDGSAGPDIGPAPLSAT